MKKSGRSIFTLLKESAKDWSTDHAPRLGAALAFYTIFSLAPLITIVISIASLWFSENASGQIFHQLGSVVGQDTAQSLQNMLVQPGKKGSGIFTVISSGVMLLLGATGVFVQLQDALNEIWEVKPKPGAGIMGFIRHRLLSVAMVLGIGFLLLVSLLLTTAMAALSKYFGHWMGDAAWLWEVVNTVMTFGIITGLFGLMFKYLPDAKICWKDVWFGALVTAFLFTIGKFGLGLYLGKSSVASTYGAAGALIIVLLWVYYSAQILFFGAELTQQHAAMAGRRVTPSDHAEWDEEKKCQSAAAESYKDRKKEKKKGDKGSIPQPAFAAGSAPGSSSGSGRSSVPATSIGGIVLLALLFIPLKKYINPR
jgi:membrane protein